VQYCAEDFLYQVWRKWRQGYYMKLSRFTMVAVLAAVPFTLPAVMGDPIQEAYLKASNTRGGVDDNGDWFSWSVAVSGDTAVIGAPFEQSYATSVNGNQSNDGCGGCGAAYVFVRSGTNWTQQAYLKPSIIGGDFYFGWSVAVLGDTAVIGAYGEVPSEYSGAAFVFVRTGTNWTQQAYLKASNTDGSTQPY
jgi:hypothetical protein